MKIKRVIIYTNGNVVAFDENEKQVKDLQGFLFNVSERLKNICDEDTKFSYEAWNGTALQCQFRWWFEGKK